MNDFKNKQTDLSRFDNSWYKPGGKFKIILWYFFNLVFFKTGFPFPNGLKRTILNGFGSKVEEGVVIKPGVSIKYPWKLEIGTNTWIGEDVWIDNLDTIKIGANVSISQGALLLSGNHDYKKTTFDLRLAPIVLEDGVWIGAKAVVCQGVTCFSHSLLTVGSIATSNLEAYKIYKGNPAVYIRDRSLIE